MYSLSSCILAGLAATVVALPFSADIGTSSADAVTVAVSAQPVHQSINRARKGHRADRRPVHVVVRQIDRAGPSNILPAQKFEHTAEFVQRPSSAIVDTADLLDLLRVDADALSGATSQRPSGGELSQLKWGEFHRDHVAAAALSATRP